MEDLTIDYEQGTAYIPSDDRRWWPLMKLPVEESSKLGHVYSFDIRREKFQRFQLIGYQHEHFHPLGISLLKRKENQVCSMSKKYLR